VSAPAGYVLPGDGVFPEGVVVRPEDDEYFATTFARGTIFRGHLDRPEAEVFLESSDGRTAGTGSARGSRR